jgi:hypothetical protein
MEHFTYIKRDWFKVNTLPEKYAKLWKMILDRNDNIEDYDDDISVTKWKFNNTSTLLEVSGYPGDNPESAVFYKDTPIYFGSDGDFINNKESEYIKFEKYIDEFMHVNFYLEDLCEEHQHCRDQYTKHQKSIEDNISKEKNDNISKEKNDNITLVFIPQIKNKTYIFMKKSPLTEEELKFLEYSSHNNSKNARIKELFYLLITEYTFDDQIENWLNDLQKIGISFTKEKLIAVSQQSNKWKLLKFKQLNKLATDGMKSSTYSFCDHTYERIIDSDSE